MLVAKITVTGTRIEAEQLMRITSGMIGAQVEVTFDEAWDGYSKVYVWNYRNVTIDDLNATGTIPAEVLERAGGWLRFGVYGTKDDCALPTLWVTVGSVDPGADPSGDESADPALPVWAQLKADIEKLKQNGVTDERIADAVADYLEENPIEVPDGVQNGDGLSNTAKTLLITVLRNAAYGSDQSANIAALEKALDGSGDSSGEEAPEKNEKTLTGVSVTYSGGDVVAGTAVTDLTGIVVTATYSDGSTETVIGYTLSGTIAEGSNTITVIYGGKTTTFVVTGVADEEENPIDPVYVLESAITTDGASMVDTGYALADKDKNWTIVSDLTGRPGYGVPAWGLGRYLGMWARSSWQWYCGYNANFNYLLEGDAPIVKGNLTNYKTVLIHNKGEATITCYYVSDSAVTSAISSSLTYSSIVGATDTVTLGGATDSAGDKFWTNNNTINDFKIYERVLTEAEINEYLGVA